MVVRKKTASQKGKGNKVSSPKKSAKKKSTTTKSKSSPKASHTTQSSEWKKKVADLHKENEILQKQINKAKKEYEQLERKSLELTKKLFEAGYIPKTSALK